MSGNLAGWQPKFIAKKDEKGNWKVLGKYTISAAGGALIVSVVLALGQYFGFKVPNLPTLHQENPAVVSVERQDNNQVLSSFSSSSVRADLVVPTGNVDIYKLVKIKSDKVADYYDLLVMTIYNGNIEMVDVVATSSPAEWVFTGPPGRYSIRLTSFAANTGFHAVTGTVIIGGTPVPNPNPNPGPGPGPNPNPNPQPNPSIPEGKYGFGPAMFKIVNEQVPADMKKYAPQIADAFEGVAAGIAAGSFTTPDAANKELAGRNRFIFEGKPADLEKWKVFFTAWSNKATELNKSGKLPNIAAEYAVVYRETMEGLRAIK